MIDKREVMEFSREFGLAPNVVEKDYVLGWLLAGIAHQPHLASSFVFKGGTCLKKCFFETYRFSEDLDFTITNPDHLNEEFLLTAFSEVGDWVYEAAGIELPRDRMTFEVFKNPRGGTSGEGRIGFRGPMQMGGDEPRIKLDLTSDEVVVLEPVKRTVHHPYSDNPEGGIEVQCYSFEEVFAEKIRALKERLRPRDLYDVVHLHRHDGFRPDRKAVMDTLTEKCSFKSIAVPTMEDFENHSGREELEVDWESMLKHQLPSLPPFAQFWQELPAVFAWLHSIVEKVERPAFPTIAPEVDETWRPPAMAQPWHSPVPLEIIRFAAANRLCVDLAYQGTRRVIEPYSLRRTRDGNLLLHATKHDTGEARSYRVDRIQGAEVTQIPFTPRYVIELTAYGPLSAPPTAR
ncbi:MAG: nucleotidyl transferase AbiEii/AbiGii toxin family protein, partial [Candidatus Binatia bacterium]